MYLVYDITTNIQSRVVLITPRSRFLFYFLSMRELDTDIFNKLKIIALITIVFTTECIPTHTLPLKY